MAAQGQYALDLLLDLPRGDGPLHRQIEQALRDGIRAGRLRPGAALPSTRALARELGVSRGVVFEAYGQLAAEGWIEARQGAPTRVADRTRAAAAPAPAAPAAPPLRFDLAPGRPDLSAFPREAWLAACRRVLRELPDAALGFPDVRGAPQLRTELAAYLGRARGIVPDPERTLVCSGVTQALALTCGVLRREGHRRLAVEDPGFHLHRYVVAHAGLEPVGVAVDEEGLDVAALEASGARAVLVTPAHQCPTGVVLSPGRRAALLAWAERVDGVVFEDDYDAEYRFDREPVGAVQALAPDRVVYSGSVAKTLAPALRVGWLVAPERFMAVLPQHKFAADGGTPLLDQLALADLIARGELDRHLRRTRRVYRRRRDALVAAVERHLPDAEVTGIAAGLHALLRLPDGVDEDRLLGGAVARGIAVLGLGAMRIDSHGPPGLMLGYAHLPEPAIERGIRALAEVVGQVRARS